MNLVIRAQSLNDQPLSEPLLGSFDARGGTIGRSDANTLTLPDPERHISRLQAEVTVADGSYAIRNAGGANAIFLNGRALAPGERGRLAHRDELHIGGYVLRVQLEEDGRTPRTITKAHVAVDARNAAGPAGDQRTDPRRMEAKAVPAAGPGNPFADLVGPSPGSAAAAADPFALLRAAPAPAAATPAATGAPARLPDDFDPFAEPEPAPAPSRPAGMAGASADLLASVGAGTGSSAGIDEAFGLQAMPRAGDADPLAAFIAGAPPGAPPVDAAPSRDPLAMFASPAQAAAEPPRAAAFNHTAELQGAYAPPRVVDTAPSPRAAAAPGEDIFAGLGLDAQPAADPFADLMAPVAPAAVAGTDRASTGRQDKHAADDGRALWSAFCEGAGVRADLPDGPVVPQMRLLGQVMREAVDGTLRLMAVRATAKQELRAAVTTIRSRNNNPLKFAPDLQLALEQLMQPPLRGFMSAPAAMQDAMHDLVGHSIGTMAGMRAALAGVLGRFEPDRLEAKLADKTMLDSLLPMNRKAKLWDLYLQHFGAIRDEAQDDFHTLFGKAFVAAYEEQLDRLPQRSEAA